MSVRFSYTNNLFQRRLLGKIVANPPRATSLADFYQADQLLFVNNDSKDQKLSRFSSGRCRTLIGSVGTDQSIPGPGLNSAARLRGSAVVMNSPVQIILDKSEELRHLLALLTPTESASQDIRESLVRLQDIAATKKRKADHTTLRPLGLGHIQDGLSNSAQRVVVAVVKSLKDQLRKPRKPTHNHALFSCFTLSSRTKPALCILDTYFTHSARGATETKILALLVSHAIDLAIVHEESHTTNEIMAEWSRTLGQTVDMIKTVERLGRCCLGILDGRDEHGRVHFDPTGFGLLAMMHAHTASLKELASHGGTLLTACKSIEGFEREALRLAPEVRASISSIATRCRLLVDDQSRLGHLLALYDSHHGSLPLENGQVFGGLRLMDNPCPQPDSAEHRHGLDIGSGSLVADSTLQSATPNNSMEPTTRPSLSRDGPEHPQEVMLRNLLSLLQGFQLDWIHEAALLRGVERQYRWNAEGDKVAIDLHHTAIQTQYASLFNDHASLMSLLDTAVENHTLIRQHGKLRSNRPLQNGGRISLDSLTFLCYICPRDETLEPSFHQLMRDLLPHFQKYFQDMSKPPTQSRLLLDVAEVCVACTYASNLDYSGAMLLAIEQNVVQDCIPDSLRLSLANARSVVLRRQGSYNASDQSIHKALERPLHSDVRTTCLTGDLHLSLAENAILRNEYRSAESIVDAIEVPDDPRLFVARLRERKWTTKARIHRFMGRFEQAKTPLQFCLGARQESSRPNSCHIVRALADIYVELQEFGSAKELLEASMLDMRRNHKEHTRAYNRLLLSLADLNIAESGYDNAENILSQVAMAFRTRPPTSQTDQLDHVRTAIASLRILMHRKAWDKMLNPATKAIGLTETYSSFTASNYYRGYITMLRAVSRLRAAEADLRAAATCVQEPRHFMTGVGTFDRGKARVSLSTAIHDCAVAANLLTSVAPPNLLYPETDCTTVAHV